MLTGGSSDNDGEDLPGKAVLGAVPDAGTNRTIIDTRPSTRHGPFGSFRQHTYLDPGQPMLGRGPWVVNETGDLQRRTSLEEGMPRRLDLWLLAAEDA